jgi:hypothetical protein
MIHYHCYVWYGTVSPSCGGGLLIFHVDSEQVANNGFHVSNLVNYGPVHGVALEQADGRRNLDADPSRCGGAGAGCSDRGDAGDPYPGATGNTTFNFRSNPAATKNSDGSFVGFAIDSIRFLAPPPQAAVTFRLRFGGVTVVQATDTSAVVQVDNANYGVFADILDSGSVHQIGVAATQYSADQRTRYTWVRWSDSGLIVHSVTVPPGGRTYVATLARAFKVGYSAAAGGTVSVSPTADTSGAYVAEGSSVTLTATPSPGDRFAGWTGDTTARGASLTLPMGRPYSVTATFLAPLATADVVAQLLNGTSPLTQTDLSALDALGNNNGRFDVGDFLAWVQATGALPTPTQRQLVRALTTQGARR